MAETREINGVRVVFGEDPGQTGEVCVELWHTLAWHALAVKDRQPTVAGAAPARAVGLLSETYRQK
jgi:hypothetical protein